MGLFKKKPDPISERAKLLTGQIAALESEIKKLAAQKSSGDTTLPSPPAPVASPFVAPVAPRPATAPASHPRLRSTALPHGATTFGAAAAPQEPIFEEVGQSRIQTEMESATPAHYNDLGVRKYDLASAWKRLKNHFKGPVTSNPKLVHYLSAGSIQGLRPLRYEKRVARNRFIFFAVTLLIVLLGLIAFIVGRH
jgi:hypothetical protein